MGIFDTSQESKITGSQNQNVSFDPRVITQENPSIITPSHNNDANSINDILNQTRSGVFTTQGNDTSLMGGGESAPLNLKYFYIAIIGFVVLSVLKKGGKL